MVSSEMAAWVSPGWGKGSERPCVFLLLCSCYLPKLFLNPAGTTALMQAELCLQFGS